MQTPVQTKSCRLCRMDHRGHVWTSGGKKMMPFLTRFHHLGVKIVVNSAVWPECAESFWHYQIRDETKGPTRDPGLPVVSERGQVTSPDGIMGGHEYSLSLHSITGVQRTVSSTTPIHSKTASYPLSSALSWCVATSKQRKSIKSTSEVNRTVDWIHSVILRAIWPLRNRIGGDETRLPQAAVS